MNLALASSGTVLAMLATCGLIRYTDSTVFHKKKQARLSRRCDNVRHWQACPTAVCSAGLWPAAQHSHGGGRGEPKCYRSLGLQPRNNIVLYVCGLKVTRLPMNEGRYNVRTPFRRFRCACVFLWEVAAKQGISRNNTLYTAKVKNVVTYSS